MDTKYRFDTCNLENEVILRHNCIYRYVGQLTNQKQESQRHLVLYKTGWLIYKTICTQTTVQTFGVKYMLFTVSTKIWSKTTLFKL